MKCENVNDVKCENDGITDEQFEYNDVFKKQRMSHIKLEKTKNFIKPTNKDIEVLQDDINEEINVSKSDKICASLPSTFENEWRAPLIEKNVPKSNYNLDDDDGDDDDKDDMKQPLVAIKLKINLRPSLLTKPNKRKAKYLDDSRDNLESDDKEENISSEIPKKKAKWAKDKIYSVKKMVSNQVNLHNYFARTSTQFPTRKNVNFAAKNLDNSISVNWSKGGGQEK